MAQVTPLRLLVLLVGITCGASSVIFIRGSQQDPILLVFYRTAIAVIALSPLFIYHYRRADVTMRHYLRTTHLKNCLLPAAIFALHFVTWNMGARATAAANATLLVNLVPVAMVGVLWLLFRELPTRREMLATALAILGVLIVSVPAIELNPEHLIGNAFCLVSMVFFAFYLALAKRFSHLPSLWLYVVPLYALTGLMCLPFGLWRSDWLSFIDQTDVLMTLALGLVPTVFGHSILNRMMQLMPGQTVSVINTFQFVIAGLLAFWLWGEQPEPLFYLGSVSIVAALMILVLRRPGAKTR
ncbi:MAG: DMT family transporter [Gammaproteobacteria bacterium]|nr:DMT family transporter [Gammaproteobacteria bacterium]